MKDPRAIRWLSRSDGLAQRLRRARGVRSQARFAEPLGWAPSKVTRIEQGIQVPTAEDVDAWADEARLPLDERRQLHAMLEEFHTTRSTFRERMRQNSGQDGVQEGYNDLTAGATIVRSYQIAWIPGTLQTHAYARAVLEHSADLHGAEDDIDQAVERRLRRRDLMFEGTRFFEFILHGSVLESVFVPPAVLREQLHMLIMATDMPRVRLGIVPLRRRIQMAPQSAFVMYDDLVVAENFAGEIKSKPSESPFYAEIYARLWGDAVEGEEARTLIRAAIDCLPPD